MDVARLEEPRSGVVGLTLVLGIGPLGNRAAELLTGLLDRTPETHRRCVRVWRDGGNDPPIADVLSDLLSATNIDTIIGSGHQIPETEAGEPPQLSSIWLVDETAGGVEARVSEFGEAAASMTSGVSRTALGLSLLSIEEAMASELARRTWDHLIPYAARSAAGVRTDEDLVATAARIALVLSLPSREGKLRQIVEGGGKALRLEAAFADGGHDSFLSALEHLVSARLIREQYGDPVEHEPAALFDDGNPTELIHRIEPLALVQELLRDTPFLIEGAGDDVFVRLSTSELAVDLHGVPREKWASALSRMREFFQFSAARSWREKLDANSERLRGELAALAVEDSDKLMALARGPDRVLAWSRLLKEKLERSLGVRRPGRGSDFPAAVRRLEEAVEAFPSPVAMWARYVLLGLLGSVAGYYVTSIWTGFLPALAVGVLIVGFAVAVCALTLHRLETALIGSRDAAIGALVASFEETMRQNVETRAREMRTLGGEDAEGEVMKVKQVGLTALAAAEQLESMKESDTQGILNVELVVPTGMASGYLEFLGVRWADLHGEAVAAGVLAPVRDEGGESRFEEDGLSAFAAGKVGSPAVSTDLGSQFDFRDAGDSGYSAKLISSIDRRASVPTPLTQSVWLMPRHAQDRFAAFLDAMSLMNRQEGQSLDLELAGCVQVAPMDGREGR